VLIEEEKAQVVVIKDVFVPKRSEEDLSFGEKVWKNF